MHPAVTGDVDIVQMTCFSWTKRLCHRPETPVGLPDSARPDGAVTGIFSAKRGAVFFTAPAFKEYFRFTVNMAPHTQ